MYTLDSTINLEKYKGLSVKEGIDQHYYAFKNMIGKNPQWYNEEVHEYMGEIISSLGGKQNIRKQYSSWMNRQNT